MRPRLTLTRDQVLAFRRQAGSLDARLPGGAGSLRRAAWAGLQDSMPRAALLSLHARVEAVEPTTWADPSLVQLWGPRFSAYVVAASDFGVFSLGRLPDEPRGRERARLMAERLHALLGDERRTHDALGRGLGFDPNALRYATATGTVAIRWDGARSPEVWTVPAPDLDPADARRELARRYLHVFGPATADGFARWAGVSRRAAARAFASLATSLVPVRSPLGDEWILADDEPAFGTPATAPAAARLLPSGDAYYLLAGSERELLVPDPGRRQQLWTTRVWPGALLVDGEIRGTWRRTRRTVRIDAWGGLGAGQRDAVEAEASSLPVPGAEPGIVVEWGT
jgi:hypothetical protein